MNVKIKRLSQDAVIPKYSKSGDAGLDLTAVAKSETDLYVEYDTGLSVAIPEGYVGLLFPRSSVSNYHLNLANSVGVVDSNYRGPIKARFKKTTNGPYANLYNVGDRVAQLIIIPYPSIELEEVDELDETNRGAGGFGSSGV